MVKYSGRTSAHIHKFDDWQTRDISEISPAISQMIVFNAQWTDCPIEVEKEVKKLWRDYEFGNDYYYAKWDSEEMSEDYPIIAEYLNSKGVTECLIHWWW